MGSAIILRSSNVRVGRCIFGESYVDSKLMKGRRSMLPMLKRNVKSSLIIKVSNEHAEYLLGERHPLEARDLVLPLFIHEGDDDIPIGTVPGCSKFGWRHGLVDEVYKARDVGISRFALIPKTSSAEKLYERNEAYHVNGLVPQAIRLLKDKYPEIVIYTDVMLDPFIPDRHGSVLWKDGCTSTTSASSSLSLPKVGKVPAALYKFGVFLTGLVSNDEMVSQLCEQALCLARAGADVVCPSGSMDRRVNVGIRSALDDEGFHDVSVMSCTSRHASTYAAMFYDVLDLSPIILVVFSLYFHINLLSEPILCAFFLLYRCDESIYGENPIRNGVIVVEGADILMVKPGHSFVNVLESLRAKFSLPVAAYQVFNEYYVIKASQEDGCVNVENVIQRYLEPMKYSGADIIFSYFAREAASILSGMK
ncbi:delta-aminolevulinic acid dehydratase, chloroplastic-like isoform X1 [Asparagus officinalis]|uniref:delta-aminolevulinic acid dehydratase, chloroplastic-like isoform X1 n=1 Tax=Asparagus officinalis TaxID=4686 RepID=UPI00098E2A37|nr:delta-aminolevulinic acid dehydratase, chloroplastic-like isoform X1 [Asparagus officinalis]